jgi:hypothetical protein
LGEEYIFLFQYFPKHTLNNRTHIHTTSHSINMAEKPNGPPRYNPIREKELANRRASNRRRLRLLANTTVYEFAYLDDKAEDYVAEDQPASQYPACTPQGNAGMGGYQLAPEDYQQSSNSGQLSNPSYVHKPSDGVQGREGASDVSQSNATQAGNGSVIEGEYVWDDSVKKYVYVRPPTSRSSDVNSSAGSQGYSNPSATQASDVSQSNPTQPGNSSVMPGDYVWDPFLRQFCYAGPPSVTYPRMFFPPK